MPIQREFAITTLAVGIKMALLAMLLVILAILFLPVTSAGAPSGAEAIATLNEMLRLLSEF